MPSTAVASTLLALLVSRNDTAPVGEARPDWFTTPITVAVSAYPPAVPRRASVVSDGYFPATVSEEAPEELIA